MISADGFGIRIEQQLSGIEPKTMLRLPRSMGAESIHRARLDSFDKPPPDIVIAPRQTDTDGFLGGIFWIENAKIHRVSLT